MASALYPSGVGWRGVNRAGMEYGDDWDGWTGQTWFDVPTAAQIADELSYFNAKGMNVIRLPISWERLQHELNGPLDATYVAGMMSYIDAATGAGFSVVLDLHNYNRYATGTHDAGGMQVDGYTQQVMGDGVLAISHLVDVWVKLTNLVQTNPDVILGLMNEPHDFPMISTAWFAGLQQVIDAIRAAGSTQLILVPNSRGSDVDHWDTYAPNGGPLDSVAALAITDGANNYAFDMHAYQDTPSSATSYASLVATVAAWANDNGKKLFLSELGSLSGTPNGAAAVGGLLAKLDSDGVWLGWTAWDLPPYALTNGTHTADAPSMAWYDPSLTPYFLGP
jgi:endoglucanase